MEETQRRADASYHAPSGAAQKHAEPAAQPTGAPPAQGAPDALVEKFLDDLFNEEFFDGDFFRDKDSAA